MRYEKKKQYKKERERFDKKIESTKKKPDN